MNNNSKVYYKVLNKDMKSTYQEFQYELNKKYEVDNDKVRLYDYGFHVCKEIYELFLYCDEYKLKDCKFFKCIIGDIIGEGAYSIVSNSIELIEELDSNLVIKEIEDHLNELINDPHRFIRATVANQGYGLDTLINDHDCSVRAAVAEQGYGLDILINDPDWFVRAAVAYQGYGLNKLINDPNWHVRRSVAEQGYGLDILINDPKYLVRKAAVYAKDKNNGGGNING